MSLVSPVEQRDQMLAPFASSETRLPSASVRSSDLLLLGDSFERLFNVAEMMAKGKVSIPRHFQGNQADCFAVVMQAVQWGMNPYAVAQKTYITPSGALGYEAQLISAVIAENAGVTGLPRYEYIGDWTKVLGKVEEKKSTREGAGKYLAATYTKEDEEGLGVRCILTIKGETEPRVMEVFMSQCYPRFSTQWATDPKMQISYVAIRKWGRQNTPGVILGVAGTEEEEDDFVPMRNMGNADVVGGNTPAANEAPHPEQANADAAAAGGVDTYSLFWANLSKQDRLQLAPKHDARKEVALKVDADRTVEAVVTTTPAADKVKPAAAKATAAATGAPVFTLASVMQRLRDAHAKKDSAALDIAADLIGAVVDEAHRDELGEAYERMSEELST